MTQITIRKYGSYVRVSKELLDDGALLAWLTLRRIPGAEKDAMRERKYMLERRMGEGAVTSTSKLP